MVTIKIKGGTAASLAAANPVLADREPCLETDTNKLKFGPGAYNSLPYFDGGGGGGAGTWGGITGTLSDQVDLQAALDAKMAKNLSFTRPDLSATTDYTLILSDAGKTIEMDKVTLNNLNVPPNSSVAFPIGTQILVIQRGAGYTNIVAGSGVTVRSKNSYVKLAQQYAQAALIKVGTDEWYLGGDITI